ncbi:MAG: O-antigen ligase family protein [Pirellulaceae bacterium]|nr:O-antigen ligase family protein [Pirellulaceae bacterium]
MIESQPPENQPPENQRPEYQPENQPPASGAPLAPASDSWRNWLGWVVGAVMAQFLWAAAYFVAPSPLYALAAVIGLGTACAIFVAPHIGVLLLSTLLIGQWPGNLITYLGLLTAVSALVWLWLNHQLMLPKSSILYLTLAFLLVGAISLLAPQTDIGARSHLLSLAGRCSLVWLFVTLVIHRSFLLVLVRLLVASGIATAIIGLIQWRTHFTWITSTTHGVLAQSAFRNKTVMDLQGWQGQFRIDSITGTPDYLPIYMQSLAPFVAFWILRRQRWYERLAGVIVLALFAMAHVLSFTRGALLTTFVVVVLLAWMIDKKRFIVYGPALAVCMLVAMLSWGPTRERLISMIEINREEARGNVNTGAWRLSIIPVAIKMIGQRPFVGCGLGQQRWNWPEETLGVLIPDPKVIDPLPIHNDYLLVGAELGIGGLIVLILLLSVSCLQLHQLAKFFRARGDPELQDVARSALLAMIGIAMAMLMYPMVDSFRYFWLFLGITASLWRISSQPMPQ